MELPKGLTLDMIQDAVKQDDNLGFCLTCGDELGGCEPDARNYECESCGEKKVFGAGELIIMFA